MQELLTLLEHLSLPPVFSGVRVFSFLCSVCRSLFVLFLLAIVLSVLLWLTYFDLVSSNSSYTPFFIVHRNIMHWCKKLSSNTCMRLWGHFLWFCCWTCITFWLPVSIMRININWSIISTYSWRTWLLTKVKNHDLMLTILNHHNPSHKPLPQNVTRWCSVL